MLDRTEYQRKYQSRKDVKERKRNSAKQCYAEGRLIVAKLLGDKCLIYGKAKSKSRSVIYHKIHGKKHPRILFRNKNSDGMKYILKHLNDFVPLCHQHHEAIHRFSRIRHNKIAQKLVKIIDV